MSAPNFETEHPEITSDAPIMEFNVSKLTSSLSAVAIVGDHLWVASDEGVTVESLTSNDGVRFRDHRSFALDGLIQLPANGTDFDQEIDIEGMDFDGSYLWIAGSHSIKRKNIKKDDPPTTEKKIKKIGKTEGAGNRFILARVPLSVDETTRAQDLLRENSDLVAAQLNCTVDTNDLIEAIKQAENGKGDLHLARFVSIPGKDNGFDIEGLAVSGDRIFLGLRGPVLRGWAMILELSLRFAQPNLALNAIGTDEKVYLKHFIELGGLGIRDLCIDDDDLLILAGPTMNLDGPVGVFRWRNALSATGSDEACVFADEIEHVCVIPNGVGVDHAEGMSLIPATETAAKRVLIVYDSPSEQRREGPNAVRAQIFSISDTP